LNKVSLIMDWQSLFAVYLQSIADGGYVAVVVLMALESSVVPLPSELVIPPAAFLAATHHTLNVPLLIAAGTVGSWIGASVMYGVCRFFGRHVALRYGGIVGITEARLLASERWVARMGTGAVLIARLMPVIRHLIGVPMGLSRMNYIRYSVMTLVGSALWCTVLAYVGIAAGNDPALLAGDLHRLSLWCLGGGVVLMLIYWLGVRTSFKPSTDVGS